MTCIDCQSAPVLYRESPIDGKPFDQGGLCRTCFEKLAARVWRQNGECSLGRPVCHIKGDQRKWE